MVVIDLFSGAGGLSEGFLREGYKIIAHVEKDKWACETLKTRIIYHFLKLKNDLDLYNKYIFNANNFRRIDADRELVFNKYPELKEIIELEVLNHKFGNPANEEGATSTKDIIQLIEKSASYNKISAVDIIIGGPPCQAYSLVGRSRMRDSVLKDKRNYLFYYYKEIVKHFEPKIFIFENVPGLLTAQKGRIFEKIQQEFNEIGYTLLSGPDSNDNKNILDAFDFGVHQRRKRVMLFGFRKELNYNYPDYRRYAKQWENVQDTWNAIGDLPAIKCGEGEDFFLGHYPTNEEPLSKYQQLMREDSIGIINHKARIIRDMDQEIYRIAIEKASIGEQLHYPDIPERLKTHQNQSNFTDRFKVHWWNSSPHTIVAHISKDGHYNIHPDIEHCRSITVREAARIQSFPDNYKFEGPRTAQYIQVGNAVPPLLSEAIAKTIKNDYIM